MQFESRTNEHTQKGTFWFFKKKIYSRLVHLFNSKKSFEWPALFYESPVQLDDYNQIYATKSFINNFPFYSYLIILTF